MFAFQFGGREGGVYPETHFVDFIGDCKSDMTGKQSAFPIHSVTCHKQEVSH